MSSSNYFIHAPYCAGEPIHTTFWRHVANRLWEAYGIGRICGMRHPVCCSLCLPGWWQRGGWGFYPLCLRHTARKGWVCKHCFSQPIPTHLLYQLQPSRQSAVCVEQLQCSALPSRVQTPTTHCRWETEREHSDALTILYYTVLCE